jgi:hypothetical protein
MTSSRERGTTIGRLRVRAAGADADAAVTQCAAAIGGLDLTPAAMNPRAILCVRALRDPLPDAIDVRAGRPRQQPLAWESATRAALGAMLQRAARPIDGEVPLDAEAVFFADEAEMLACAARDACRGPLSWCWWWRHVFPDASFERIVEAWQRAPTYVPAAFEALTRLDAAMPWIRRLSPALAAAVLDAMLRAHALPSLADDIAAVWKEPLPKEADERARPERSADPSRRFHRAAITTRGAAPPPWRGVVPVDWDQPSLEPCSRTFAAMCIVLRRSPWLPRGSSFSLAVVAYLREARQSAAGGRRAAAETAVRGERLHESPRRLDAPPAPARDAHPAASHTPAPPESAPRTSTVAPTGESPPRAPDASPVPPIQRRSSGSSPDAAAAAPRARRRARPADRQRLPAETDTSPPCEPPRAAGAATAPDATAAIESAFAGAFFLINVALDLELYSHGVTVHEDIELGIWRFVELTARALIHEQDDEDPLWALLASLADPEADPCQPCAGPDLPLVERDRLLARVRARLTDLLDVEDPGVFLVERRGRITRSPGHLDVSFSLERHPIEIRLARLDRNPGWIPAAGVHVGFHFD